MQLRERDESARLIDGAVEEAALDAVFEHIPWAAFVCDEKGRIVRANSAAQRVLAGNRASWEKTIARAVSGKTKGDSVSVSELTVPGYEPHFLVVAKTGTHRVGRAVETAREAWGLSAREVEVLGGIATGQANRDIAAELRLAARTIELHVTSLLRKASVESRAQLIIALWKLSDAPPGQLQ